MLFVRFASLVIRAGVVATVGVTLISAPAAAVSAPNPPANLRATTVTATTLSASWDPVTSQEGAVGYTAYVTPGGGLVETDATTATFTRLQPATAYTVWVMSRIGYQAYSQRTTVRVSTIADTNPPVAPQVLRLADTRSGRATVSWQPSTDDDQITAYQVYADGEPQFAAPQAGTSSQAVLRHLSPGTTRIVTVRATDRSGNVSASSPPLTVAMPPGTDNLPPSVPTELAFGWETGTFTWRPSADNVTARGLVEYSLYVDGVEANFVTGHTSNDFYFDYGYCEVVLPAGPHTYTVRAVDASGNTSAPSNALVLTN